MNKIVREHYPASKLPADLRDQIDLGKQVTITIEVEEEAPSLQARKPREDWFSKHEHIRRDNYKTDQEVIDYVRALRDEWSHRER